MRDAVVIVLRRRDRVLVIRRAAGVARAGYWMPPSGRVEAGETQQQAIVREAREELGLEVAALSNIWECCTDDGGYRLHWWLATESGDEPTPLLEEVAELRWVTTAQFLQLAPIFDAHREFFERVLPGLG